MSVDRRSQSGVSKNAEAWGVSLVALLTFLSASSAIAGQNITVSTDLGGVSACGNSTNTTTGVAGTVAAGMTNCTQGRNDNTITLTTSGKAYNLSGGATATNNSTLSNNTVIVNGGEVTNAVQGAAVASGVTSTLSNNTVIVNGGLIGSYILGASSAGGGVVSGNAVIVNDVTGVPSTIAGGRTTGNADITGNKVILNGGNITGGNAIIVGGIGVSSSNVSGNTVIIQGGTVTGVNSVIAGGYLTGAGSYTVSDNTVTITADSGTVPAFNATRTILYGGQCTNAGAVCTFTGNTLNLSTEIKVRGAQNFQNYNFYLGDDVNAGDTLLTVVDPVSITGTAIRLGTTGTNKPFMKNDVVILVNKVNASYVDVLTGIEQNGTGFVGVYDFGLNSAAGGALTATVTSSLLAGGRGDGHHYAPGDLTIQSDFAGGYADGTTHTTATGNTLDIGTDFTNTGTILYGGFCKTGAGCGDTTSGNTLRLTSTVSVKEAWSFQYYNFVLNDTLVGNTVPMLTTTGTIAFTPSAAVKLDMNPASSPLMAGDTILLINQASGYTANRVSTVWRNGAKDEIYVFDVGLDGGNQLLATLRGSDVVITPPAASALGAQGATAVAINSDFDFLAFEGIHSAADAAGQGISAGDPERIQGGVFSTTKGGWMHSYSTAGKTRIGGSSVLAGVSVGVPLARGTLLLGGFGEGGWSRYDDSTNGIDGKGTITTAGGGFLLHYQRGGLYGELVGRIGRANNSYHNEAVRYATHSTYYGTYVGSGYMFDLGAALDLDVSSKYFWTRQTGSNLTIMGDEARFEAIDSHRWRNGGRLHLKSTPHIVPYVGGHYEYEFGNDAKGMIAGLDIPSISRQGGSVIGEIGAAFHAREAVKIDAGVSGSVGKREGAIASVKVRWGF